MIVSFNFYYARPGREDAVLQQRLRACEVRENLGIPRGRVLARTTDAAALPDVIWEQPFDDVAGHHADMAVRAASPAFESIRAGMRELCRRFERPLFEICGGDGSTVTSPALSSGVVTLAWIFCVPEETAEALAVLDQHARLCAQRGFEGGRLLRLITPGSDLPELVWQHEYADAVSHGRMQAEIASCPELYTGLAAVAALAPRVERSVWKLA